MKSESLIDQKELIRLITAMNEKYKTKIKIKGSITDLAEAFAVGVEELSNRNETLPDTIIDFFNDLFSDEAVGYKDVEVAQQRVAELEEELAETEAFLESKPAPGEEDLEEFDELEPEQELPGEDDSDEEPNEDFEELEDELEDKPEPEPPKRGRGRPPKLQPKPTAKKPVEKKILKDEGDPLTMLQLLESVAAKKADLKAFVKEHNINVKLRNNESAAVWKAKIKKMLEPAPEPVESSGKEDSVNHEDQPAPETPKTKAKAPKKSLAKRAQKPQVEAKAKKKAETRPEPKKPAQKAQNLKKVVEKAEKAEKKEKKAKSEGKDPFGIVKGSLTHAFVQAVYKKPQTMQMLTDAGIGKHPKTLRKLIAMGYMERDKAGIITMTVNGRKVYGGGEK